MSIVFVQFESEKETVVISVFGCPQDPEVWPNQGEVEEDDPRYQAFIHPELQPAAILKVKQDQKDALLAAASQAMTPVFMALQLDATDATTAKARIWHEYYQALEAVDVTVSVPVWPTMPE